MEDEAPEFLESKERLPLGQGQNEVFFSFTSAECLEEAIRLLALFLRTIRKSSQKKAQKAPIDPRNKTVVTVYRDSPIVKGAINFGTGHIFADGGMTRNFPCNVNIGHTKITFHKPTEQDIEVLVVLKDARLFDVSSEGEITELFVISRAEIEDFIYPMEPPLINEEKEQAEESEHEEVDTNDESNRIPTDISDHRAKLEEDNQKLQREINDTKRENEDLKKKEEETEKKLKALSEDMEEEKKKNLEMEREMKEMRKKMAVIEEALKDKIIIKSDKEVETINPIMKDEEIGTMVIEMEDKEIETENNNKHVLKKVKLNKSSNAGTMGVVKIPKSLDPNVKMNDSENFMSQFYTSIDSEQKETNLVKKLELVTQSNRLMRSMSKNEYVAPEIVDTYVRSLQDFLKRNKTNINVELFKTSIYSKLKKGEGTYDERFLSKGLLVFPIFNGKDKRWTWFLLILYNAGLISERGTSLSKDEPLRALLIDPSSNVSKVHKHYCDVVFSYVSKLKKEKKSDQAFKFELKSYPGVEEEILVMPGAREEDTGIHLIETMTYLVKDPANFMRQSKQKNGYGRNFAQIEEDRRKDIYALLYSSQVL